MEVDLILLEEGGSHGDASATWSIVRGAGVLSGGSSGTRGVTPLTSVRPGTVVVAATAPGAWGGTASVEVLPIIAL